MLNRTTVVAEAIGIARYHALFGSNPDVTSDAWYWLDLEGVPRNATPCHLLWAQMFLKVYRNESVHAAVAGANKDAFRKWFWRIIDALSLLVTRLVSWIK